MLTFDRRTGAQHVLSARQGPDSPRSRGGAKQIATSLSTQPPVIVGRSAMVTTATPDHDLLDPTNDAVFRMFLLRNPPLLHAMLEAVLGEPILGFTVLDREIRGETPPDKAIVLDVLVELLDGRRVNVEMQVRARREIKPRLAFYAARNYADQLARGEGYLALRPSIVIVWLVEPLFPELEQFHSVFELREQSTHACYGDELTLHLLQLSKLSNAGAEGPFAQLAELWGQFFTAKTRLDFVRLKEQNHVMAQAVDALEELSLDPVARRAARKRWEDAKFYEMGLAMTREEGVATGKVQALLIVLEARQLEVTEDDRKRILATTGAEQLDRMMRRAATANTTAEIFDSSVAPGP
jgi:predicted transposase/invertase (TIGR01784 family)